MWGCGRFFLFVNDCMKLIGPHLVKKFHSFYGTQRFITAFTRVHHLSPILSHIKTVLGPPPTPKSDFWNEKVRGDRDRGREHDILSQTSTTGASLVTVQDTIVPLTPRSSCLITSCHIQDRVYVFWHWNAKMLKRKSTPALLPCASHFIPL